MFQKISAMQTVGQLQIFNFSTAQFAIDKKHQQNLIEFWQEYD